MAEVLVVVEHAGGAVKKVTLEMLTMARELGSPSAVVFGAADALTDKLAEFGAETIYVASGDDVEGYLVAPKAAILANLIREKSPAAVLLGSTQEGKEIAARVAVKLDNGLLTDVLALDADGTATQAIFAGSTVVKSKITRGLPLVTVRPNSLTPTPAPAAGTVTAIDATVDDAAKLVKVESRRVRAEGLAPGTDRSVDRGIRRPRCRRARTTSN